MDTLEELLAMYQHELGALLARKRSLENQAVEMAQRAAIVEARIAGIQEAVTLIGASAEQQQSDSAKRKRQRALSGPWKAIMAMADRVGKSFDYDDLERFAMVIGHRAGRDTLRSQMSGYKAGGLVESVGDGRFALTDLGRAAAGIEAEDEKETSREEQQYHDSYEDNLPDPDPDDVPF